VSERKSLELRVSVDVGYRRHSVAMGLSSGEVLEEFEIDHRPEGFVSGATKDCQGQEMLSLTGKLHRLDPDG
jgi:hypothetical protein